MVVEVEWKLYTAYSALLLSALSVKSLSSRSGILIPCSTASRSSQGVKRVSGYAMSSFQAQPELILISRQMSKASRQRYRTLKGETLQEEDEDDDEEIDRLTVSLRANFDENKGRS